MWGMSIFFPRFFAHHNLEVNRAFHSTEDHLLPWWPHSLLPNSNYFPPPTNLLFGINKIMLNKVMEKSFFIVWVSANLHPCIFHLCSSWYANEFLQACTFPLKNFGVRCSDVHIVNILSFHNIILVALPLQKRRGCIKNRESCDLCTEIFALETVWKIFLQEGRGIQLKLNYVFWGLWVFGEVLSQAGAAHAIQFF